MPDLTDEAIALAVQHGDTDSFGLLIERYEPKLTRYAKKFLFDSADGQDLVQEVFIKTYMNIQSFDTQRRFSPWIYRIAHNEFINAVKKKIKTPVFTLDFDTFFPHPVARETADSNIHKQELRQMLDQCLNKISAKYREPLVLYYFQELDYAEIGEILQIPISTVGVRLKRGKMMLQKLVTQANGT